MLGNKFLADHNYCPIKEGCTHSRLILSPADCSHTSNKNTLQWGCELPRSFSVPVSITDKHQPLKSHQKVAKWLAHQILHCQHFGVTSARPNIRISLVIFSLYLAADYWTSELKGWTNAIITKYNIIIHVPVILTSWPANMERLLRLPPHHSYLWSYAHYRLYSHQQENVMHSWTQ